MTVIVCGFPGVGKTTLCQRTGWSDSDSSKFPKARFPENYVEHLSGIDGVVLVSTHKVVRDALFAAGMRFSLCYPWRDCKGVYLQRYEQRGSPREFIELLRLNWDAWITEMEREHRAKRHYVLGPQEYISDVEQIIRRDNGLTRSLQWLK